MKEQKQNQFDVPPEGTSSRYCTMAELMERYNSLLESHDYENAEAVLDYALQSGYLPAKLLMARLLKNTPSLRMEQQERYALSEKFYREILNLLDLSDNATAKISMELAELYETLNRPVACLGAMLKAKRLGYPVQDKDAESCLRKLNRMDINSFCNHPQDCYDLGSELAMAGSFRFAEFFLRESCASLNRELAGRSCLMLADLYDGHRADCPAYGEEARKMYQEAAEKGFPEYLTKCRETMTSGPARAYAV